MAQQTVESAATGQSTADVTMIDPRAPRFGQFITATVLTLAVVLQRPELVVALAAILVAAVLSGWRVDLYQILWRDGVQPLVGKPATTEPAAPHRFAKVMGAGFTTLASILLYLPSTIAPPDVALAGYGVAGLVAILATISAVGDYCIGCKLYKQVSLFRRLNIV